MTVIKYNIVVPNTENVLAPVVMEWNEANESLAKREAVNGEYIVEEYTTYAGIPSQLDRIEAQIAYTAMMTDTLLEV